MAKKKSKGRKSPKKVSKKKKTTKKSKKSGGSQKGTWGKSMKSGADKTVHMKATTWGIAREKFKREKRSLVFRTAKKCPTHNNCYIVYYNKRHKDTAKPTGTATNAAKRIFGTKPKKTAKKSTKKKSTKSKKRKR